MSANLHIVSRRSAYELSNEERQDAKAIHDAYQLVMLLSNTPFISAQGLEIDIRIQAHLCRQYNDILLKGWMLQ